ncbi:MacS family sensor histidine kinase [Pilimelia columellifera]|uniref:DUF5931 domain-containing protein n=1 Tax=Pilimelia columellifera subsp. columellifera TaxID=706583 RepID=A0ABN3N781_9ACTN
MVFVSGSDQPPSHRPGRLLGPLWRAVAVFRLAALAYVGYLTVANADLYQRPAVAWAVLALMAGWTGFTWWAYAAPGRRTWRVLVPDLGVTAVIELSTVWVIGVEALTQGIPTMAVAWMAGPVLAWSIAGGRRLGVAAALFMGAVEIVVRGAAQQTATTGTILMLLAAVSTGHVARLAGDTERLTQAAIEREAAARERERLARGIHDSVLQVLAMVARRGARLDGEAGELARLAGEQEAALRALIGSSTPAGGPAADDTVDLSALINGLAGRAVSVATPAEPTLLPAAAAHEVARAVRAALDNVARHGGLTAKAWVLVEDEPGAVTVTVRDDGVGIPPGRLTEAAAGGRLGVAQSIQGRIADLGGVVSLRSEPGEGTEIELRVPRRAR